MQFNQIVKSAAIDYNNLIENSVRIWELSRDTNPYMYRRERHIRRYGISPLPHFLNGLGLWTVSQSETYSIQTKRAVSEIRARLISRLINAAEKCHKLSNFQSCKTILCGLQSLSVYRLHKTWMYVRKRHATKYQIFEILSRLYRDPRMPNYQKAFLKASETPPYLPYLGDLMLKLLHSNVCMYELIEKPKLSEENLKSIQKSRSLRTLQRVLIGMKLLSVDDVFEGGPPLNLYDEKLNILEKAVVFLENAQKSARAYNFQGNDLADEYLLKSRYRDDKENFFNSFIIEKPNWNRFMYK
ncbi:hypothetical protein FQA39_LY18473 [Lamprigera yunnana]|nr:hypothetical protein FQA39_LY18473 [Lamprigera yunnana]